MTKLQKAILSCLSVIALVLSGAVLWLYLGKWQAPLGAPLQIATVTPFGMPPTWTPDPNLTSSLQPTPDSVSVVQASPAPTMTPSVGLCGGPPVMNILLIGSDARADSYNYGLADVIRLARVDFVNPRVTVLEIPRDLWVEIPDIADNLNGQDHEKLNQAYLYGNPGFGYTNDPAQGPGLLARTLTLNFGTQIDHYAAGNMTTFVKIVNTVGGIDVTLPKAVDGRTAADSSDRLFFRAGTLHLEGSRALTLARIRIEGGFARADNQNRVLCALGKKLTSPDVIKKIPKLIQSFQGAMQTDLSPQQLGQLACLATQVEPQNVVFTSFPQELFKQNRVYDPVFKKNLFAWDVDFDILREYIKQFNSGEWPPATPAQTEMNEGDLNEGDSLVCE